MTRAELLAARRRVLLARSAELRERLAADGRSISTTLAPLERGVALGRSAARQPVLLIGALALLLWRGRALMRLTGPLALLWPVARRLLPGVLRALAARRARTRRAQATAAQADPARSARYPPQDRDKDLFI